MAQPAHTDSTSRPAHTEHGPADSTVRAGAALPGGAQRRWQRALGAAGAPRPLRAQARPGPARTRSRLPAADTDLPKGNFSLPTPSTGVGLLKCVTRTEPGGSAAGPPRLGSEGTLPAELGSV